MFRNIINNHTCTIHRTAKIVGPLKLFGQPKKKFLEKKIQAGQEGKSQTYICYRYIPVCVYAKHAYICHRTIDTNRPLPRYRYLGENICIYIYTFGSKIYICMYNMSRRKYISTDRAHTQKISLFLTLFILE